MGDAGAGRREDVAEVRVNSLALSTAGGLSSNGEFTIRNLKYWWLCPCGSSVAENGEALGNYCVS